MWRGKLDGIWWLPGDPTNKVSATLESQDDGRLRLVTVGTLVGLQSFGHDHRPDLIVGMTRQGKKVTLVQPVAVHWQLTAPGVPSTTYVSPVTVLGHLFESLDEVVFDRLEVEYPLLMEWANAPASRSATITMKRSMLSEWN